MFPKLAPGILNRPTAITFQLLLLRPGCRHTLGRIYIMHYLHKQSTSLSEGDERRETVPTGDLFKTRLCLRITEEMMKGSSTAASFCMVTTNRVATDHTFTDLL